MAANVSLAVIKQVEAVYSTGVVADLTDGQLLERFVDMQTGPATEAAFTVLVDRHGAMVLRICRQILHDEHAAEDAFQATFLVLARRSRSIAKRESVASWLYGVALRVAAKARAAASRQRWHERRCAEVAATRSGTEPGDNSWAELHEELARLPEAFRAPLVLVYLEGHTQEQAAAHLRCPLGTVQSRLARGRAKLKERLTRRGVAPSLGLLAVGMPVPAVPVSWAASATRVAINWGTRGGVMAHGTVPASVVLAKEVVRAMIVIKLRIVLGIMLAAATLSMAAWVWPRTGAAVAKPADAGIDAPGPGVVIKGVVVGPDRTPLVGARLGSPIVKVREKGATTGPDGAFILTAEERPGFDFPLRVDAPGMASKMFTIETTPRLPTTPPIGPVGPPSTVLLMGTMGEIRPELEMGRGVVVTGRVVRDGKPVSGATVGIWRDARGFDALLGGIEVKADGDGRFRFPNAPADATGWASVTTGSLQASGAVPPKAFRTGGDGSSTELGDLEVRPGRRLAGRVVFSDGKPVPRNAVVLAAADHVGGSLRAKVNAEGRFEVVGLPEGQVDVCVYFPDDRTYAPAGYRASARNRCLDPLNPWRLVGRLDRDLTGLTILFEPGAQPAPSLAPDVLANFKRAQAGTIAGVPPQYDGRD
ncbi:MAG: sigma-70 family RNA polymerase sigma factor [Isosphaeraceae bacterium]|nr:sigma-70 family RNA polymerase sigma factor [Isosphaeraceae bacterium]